MSSRSDSYSRRPDIDRDRDNRDRRPNPSARESRERAVMGNKPRDPHEVRASEPKLNHVKIGEELGSFHRALWDLNAERGRLNSEIKNEEKLFKRREQDYKDLAASAQFPAVQESFQRHKDAYRKTVDAKEKELARLNERFKNLEDGYVDRIVKNVSFPEIKIRQVVEAVKKDLGVPQKLVSEDRFAGLEQRLKTLSDTQELQAQDLLKLKKENDTLHAENTSYKAQAAGLAALQTQYEQLKDTLSSQKTRTEDLEALAQKRDALAIKQVDILRSHFDSLLEQFETHKVEFKRVLEDIKSQNNRVAPADAASTQDLVAMKQRIDKHDNQLSHFDGSGYIEAMEKLVSYPSWDNLSSRLIQYDNALQSLRGPVASMSQFREDMEKRFKSLEKTSGDNFLSFSNRIVDSCGKMIEDVRAKTTKIEKKLGDLEEARGPPNSRAASVTRAAPLPLQIRPTCSVSEDASFVELKKDLAALRDQVKAVDSRIDVLGSQADENCKAQELMIHSLDSQFKNMSTIEMAGIILENMKRLPQSTISLDVQNFHERLVKLEEAQQDEMRRHMGLQKIKGELKRNLLSVQSGLGSPREPFAPRKRQNSNETQNERVEN